MTAASNDPVSNTGLGVGCFNCNGLGNSRKRELVLKWLQDKEDSIFLLQETHSTLEMEPNWIRDWNGTVLFSHGTSNYTGVAILITSKA
jgi:exonuclease III